MSNAVLTEHQSACRAAHQQVQLLQHLYERLPGHLDQRSVTRFAADLRKRELAQDRKLLSGKLEELDLLRTKPDPEKEGLIEVLTELKRAFSAADDGAVAERLLAEESELLRSGEQLAGHDSDQAIADSVARTRAAIARLEAVSDSGD